MIRKRIDQEGSTKQLVLICHPEDHEEDKTCPNCAPYCEYCGERRVAVPRDRYGNFDPNTGLRKAEMECHNRDCTQCDLPDIEEKPKRRRGLFG